MNIPPGFVNLTYRFTRQFDSEVMVTAWGFSWDGVADEQDIVNDCFDAWVASGMQDNTTNSTTLVGVEGAFGTLGDGDFRVESSNGSQAGNSTADPLPNNCAWLFKKLTGLGGRKNRGRMYYPDVLATAVLGDGSINTPSREDIQTGLDDWITKTEAVAGLVELHLLHTDESDNPTPISQIVVQNKIATQRRRMRP